MNIKPFGKRIYFKPIKLESVILTTNDRLTDTGEVLEVGSQVTEIKKGDLIAFNGYGANEVEIEGEKYHFVLEDDDVILAVFEK